MAKVEITEKLYKQIEKTFSTSQANKLFDMLEYLEENPHKGKKLSAVSGVLIKEIKFLKYRFYCITDNHVLKFGTQEELADLLIKFIRMSEKKDQQKTINEIKDTLQSLGFQGF